MTGSCADRSMNRTGVYLWMNVVNGKVYVGSASKSFWVRYVNHYNRLQAGTHYNRHLQSAWNKVGRKNFRFRVVEECSPEECISREQYWIDEFQAYNREYGYNLQPTAGSNLGRKFGPQSEEHKAKKSEGLKRAYAEGRRARGHSPETRKKIGDSQRGKPRPCPARRGKPLSPEHRKHISESHKGKKKPWLAGRIMPQVTRDKLSTAHKGRRKPWCERLTEAQVREIRARHVPGDRKNGIAAIARDYGLNSVAIWRLIHGKTYQWVV